MSTSIALLSRSRADPAALARKIADRHFGVGGDGLILICPSEVADARMRMFNADGSEAEMCGNGVRCVAKYVYDHGLARKPTLKIETGRGVLTLDLEVIGGRAERIRVDMGEPILEAAKIPVEFPGQRRFAAAGQCAVRAFRRRAAAGRLGRTRGSRSANHRPSRWAIRM